MKDLTRVFIDLSKCTEEQRKSLPQILKNAGENIYEETLDNLLNDRYDDEYIYLAQFFDGEWVRFNDKLSRIELTYPEFIKLFEGGETIKSDNTQTLQNALEQIEKLQADKEEMVRMLERCENRILPTENHSSLLRDLNELIQKMKQ